MFFILFLSSTACWIARAISPFPSTILVASGAARRQRYLTVANVNKPMSGGFSRFGQRVHLNLVYGLNRFADITVQRDSPDQRNQLSGSAFADKTTFRNLQPLESEAP